jgi:hypothetical protein
MLRSLIAVVAAAIVGLATAKFIEGAAQTGMGLTEATAPAYQFALFVGWGLGAFAAAATALLMGKRWAPLGWLAAAGVFLIAALAMISFSASWLLWPAAMLATGGGGFAAVRLLRARTSLPVKASQKGLFDG